MPDRSTIAVIIPAFNAARWIGDALDSVLGQDASHLEVVVVDDGSTDDTRELVGTKYPTVKVIAVNHGGVSRARNIGTLATVSSFVQYLDADDLLSPGKLRRQQQLLDTTGADVAYGGWRRLVQRRDGAFGEAEVVTRAIEGPAELALFGNFWCPPAAYLFRRAIIERTGGWNESLPVIQDARFALDCALQGGQFVFTGSVDASYRVHYDQSLSRRDQRAFLWDLYRNADQIAEWWTEHGGVTPERRRALLAVYENVARGSYVRDRSLFASALATLERLEPGFVPRGSKRLALVARMFGYERAEALAVHYRRLAGKATPRLSSGSPSDVAS